MSATPGFARFVEVARGFWPQNVLPEGDQVILVEAMSQDHRVTLRNLTVANAMRRRMNARVVLFGGADQEWNETVWSYYDYSEVEGLAEAFGVGDVFDIQALVDRRVRGEQTPCEIAGVELGGALPDIEFDAERLEKIVDATVRRLAKVPAVAGRPELAERVEHTRARTVEFARVYEALFRELDVVALVTSHVDYNNWGVAIESALRHDARVLFVQSTGGLKVYQFLPGELPSGAPIRAGLTKAIAAYFEEHVWTHRELLRRPAELTTWRSKGSVGWPAWWTSDPFSSRVDLADADERAVVRRYAARRVGLDPDKPIITVFDHGVSDAPGTNLEAYRDLAAWFEETARFASDHPEVGWLFLDHPKQDLYDSTDHFGRIAASYAAMPHLDFRPSTSLSKNFVVALSDLVLTVRGSVSNEYPAFGIPALQAGWSEWSHCGFTQVAETPEDYETALSGSIRALLAGEPLITADQVERARLWGWFYRSLSDVDSPLVPGWHVGREEDLHRQLCATMRQTEVDADPAFVAVNRMWDRSDPFLTRADMYGDPAAIARRLAGVATL